jgi:hypothetical protein
VVTATVPWLWETRGLVGPELMPKVADERLGRAAIYVYTRYTYIFTMLVISALGQAGRVTKSR